MATAWHSNKFLNPVTDGAVLPALHLNGYKINNPTVLARIPHAELRSLFVGYGWNPYFVEGDDLASMHQAMAATLERAVDDIRAYQRRARTATAAGAGAAPARRCWPLVILHTPKGWTAPARLDGHRLAGSWRSHQVPIPNPAADAEHMALLESWMRRYEPEQLFDAAGAPVAALRALCPEGRRRMSANPVANGGLVRRALRVPDFRAYAMPVARPAATRGSGMKNMGRFLRDIIAQNPSTFRLFGPDETESNKLAGVYEAGRKVWMGDYLDDDADGSNLTPAGRVMEILSEHTVEGWLEGYILSGRHGLLNSYEPFIHIIDSMVGQVRRPRTFVLPLSSLALSCISSYRTPTL